jgi:hypothetical protein
VHCRSPVRRVRDGLRDGLFDGWTDGWMDGWKCGASGRDELGHVILRVAIPGNSMCASIHPGSRPDSATVSHVGSPPGRRSVCSHQRISPLMQSPMTLDSVKNSGG